MESYQLCSDVRKYQGETKKEGTIQWRAARRREGEGRLRKQQVMNNSDANSLLWRGGHKLTDQNWERLQISQGSSTSP